MVQCLLGFNVMNKLIDCVLLLSRPNRFTKLRLMQDASIDSSAGPVGTACRVVIVE